MKTIYFFVIFSFRFAFCEESYATNFDPGLGWGQHIAYGTNGVDQNMFRDFVGQQISKFNDLFGSYHNFTYFANFQDLRKFDRYVVFRQSSPFECGVTYAFDIKGSYVYLSTKPDNCGEDESMGLILTLLGLPCVNYAFRIFVKMISKTENFTGFSNLIRRWDRDRFVTLLWDNINPIHKSQLYKDYELFNSTDPVFDTIDLESIMLISDYSPNAKDPSKPIIKPVDNTESNVKKLALHKRERKVTSTDIKQYQAIYK